MKKSLTHKFKVLLLAGTLPLLLVTAALAQSEILVVGLRGTNAAALASYIGYNRAPVGITCYITVARTSQASCRIGGYPIYGDNAANLYRILVRATGGARRFDNRTTQVTVNGAACYQDGNTYCDLGSY